MTPEQKANILEILDSAKDLTVATVREDGYPQATTVSFVHDGLAIYFGCALESQKARNIKQSDKISLTILRPGSPLLQGWEEWPPPQGGLTQERLCDNVYLYENHPANQTAAPARATPRVGRHHARV